jgi:hypothetical protein
MSRPLYILAHALASGVFMFVLQAFALRAATETAVALALVFGLAGAGLAWHQSNR